MSDRFSLKRIINKLSGSEEQAAENIFYIMFVAGLLVFGTSSIYSLLEGLGLVSVLPQVISAAGFFLLFVLARLTKKFSPLSFVGMLLVVGFTLPAVFFTSGGVDSGIIIWMVLGEVSLLFVLEGKALAVAAGLGMAADIFCLTFAFLFPESVSGVPTREGKILDVAAALISSVILIALFMRIQRTLFETEREKNEKQQAELTEALSTQSRFLANMSHEIRTPINTVIGLNEMTLREENLPEEIYENSTNIQMASRMLLSLINDILDLSKIDSGKMDIIPERYDAASVFSDIVNTNFARATEKGLAFNVAIDPEIPSMLYGDEMRIRQVATNIITNAIKYTPEGSVTVSFSAKSLDADHITLVISVADTGIGIKREDMGKLFNSFQRVDEGKTKGIEGTGLGLTIVKQLTDLMGGEVTVDSIYGQGSTFTFSLPQKIMSKAKVGEVNLKTQTVRSAGGRYKESFEAPGARVLVCDDNEMNLLVVKKLLRRTRVQLDAVSSGAEALKRTKQKEYHVILMDHVMPVMDGVQTLNAIREQDGLNRRTPVIALTANAMSGAAEKYGHLGFSDYLSKPINSALLEAMILHYLPENLVESRNGEKEMKSFTISQGRRKQKVKITVDSACDIPKEELDAMDVGVDFHYVLMDTGRYQDNREIFSQNLISYLEKHPYAKAVASSPSVEEYEKFFSDALTTADNVVHIALASNNSISCDVARHAAESFSHVNVFDSMTFCGGMGIMVDKAARMAMGDADPAEILNMLEKVRDTVDVTFVVDQPEALYHSEWISRPVYRLVKALKLHPSMQMKNNAMKIIHIYMGDTEKVYRQYIRNRLKGRKDIDPECLYISYTSLSQTALDRVEAEALSYIPFKKVKRYHASSAIGATSGPGALGLMFDTIDKK